MRYPHLSETSLESVAIKRHNSTLMYDLRVAE
jgi:hypothetical protein